jgi:sporulation protein YlmC with PRC-barrel domain
MVSLNEYSSEYLEKGHGEMQNMDNKVSSFALGIALDEIQKNCSGVKNTFIFSEDGEIITGDENTPEKTIVRAVDTFDSIIEKGETIGGVEEIALDYSKGRVQVFNIDHLRFVTVTSKKADMKYVNTVARVLIPTILRLIDKTKSVELDKKPSKSEIEPEVPKINKPEKATDETIEEVKVEDQEKRITEAEFEPALQELPTCQFIVENLGGLLVPTDTVRIDDEILIQWSELHEDGKIEEVEVETFGGRSTRCKVKPIKSSKYVGKGIMQMPEKIRSSLEVRKGELVRVKPVIE